MRRLGFLWAVAVLCALAEPVSAQVATPDRKLSDDQPDYYQGAPALSARGKRVVATWAGLGFIGSEPAAGMATARSQDGGLQWTLEPTIPMFPRFLYAGVPITPLQAEPGKVRLACRAGRFFYYTGTGSLGQLLWSAPSFPLDRINISSSQEVHGLAADSAGTHIYGISSEYSDDYVDNHISFIRSADGGATWSPTRALAGPTAIGGSIVVDGDGAVHVSWVDYVLGQVFIIRSTDQGATFGPPRLVADIRDNLSARPLGWYHDGVSLRPLAYYRYGSDDYCANFPALAVDRGRGPRRGSLYLAWADHAEGSVTQTPTPVSELEPNDTFATAQPIPMDCVFGGGLDHFTGTDFVDVFTFNGIKGETIELDSECYGPNGTGVALYMERTDASLIKMEDHQIAVLGVSGRFKPELRTLPRSGRYFVKVAGGSFGSTYAVWLRRYNIAPGSVARDMRDIVLTRSTDGGQTWSGKQRVNRDAAGADQAFPNVAVDERGRVYVAWYDRRAGTDGLDVAAYAARSDNGGASFGDDLKVSSRLSNWQGVGQWVWDRIGLTAGDDYGIVAWMDARDFPSRNPEAWYARIVDVPTATDAVSDFAAEPVAGGVRLRWLVNDSRSVTGVRAYRSEQGGAELALGAEDRPASGNGSAAFTDDTAEPGRTYDYRLRVSTPGGTRWLGPVTAMAPARITSLAWRAAWPNPFARRTSVKLAVPQAAVGVVRVYDVQGKQVATLAEGAFEPGERTIEWDGRHAGGGQAAPGIYFLTAQVGDQRVQMRVARVE